MLDRLKQLAILLVTFGAGYATGVLHLGSQLDREQSEAQPAAAVVAAGSEPAAPDGTAGMTADVDSDSARTDTQDLTSVSAEPATAQTPVGADVSRIPDEIRRMVTGAPKQLLDSFEAQPVDPVWAAQMESDLRLALERSPYWDGAHIESLQCRTSLCLAYIYRRITPGSTLMTFGPEDLPPGMGTVPGLPAEVPNEQALRWQVVFYRKKPQAADGG